MYKYKRFECVCGSAQHSIRIAHSLEYKDINIEVLIYPYPEYEHNNKYPRWLNSFVGWVKGIKNAVFGLDNWYTSDILLDSETSREIGEYLIKVSKEIEED
jgi:hypothetical protein